MPEGTGETTMGKRVVVGGTFDIIHVGHIRFLRAAKELAGDNGELIVIVARDETVKRLKGRYPIFPERERLEIVKNLKPVDRAILGKRPEEGGLFDILLEIKPDLVALGYDQKVDERALRAWARARGLEIEVVRLPHFCEQEISSSSSARNKLIAEMRRTIYSREEVI